MALSFQETYSVTVTFRKSDGSDITDSDIQSAELRAEIKKKIAEVCTVSKGIFEAQPGTVGEA